MGGVAVGALIVLVGATVGPDWAWLSAALKKARWAAFTASARAAEGTAAGA